MSDWRRLEGWHVAALSAAGTVAGHALAYWAAHGDQHERSLELARSGHGYWSSAVLLAAFAALAALLSRAATAACGRTPAGRPRSSPAATWARLALVQVVAFIGLEVLERAVAGAGTEVWAEPAVLIALPLLLLTAAGLTCLLNAAEALGSALAGRRSLRARRSPPRFSMGPARPVPRCAPHARLAPRAPPGLLPSR